MRFSLHTGYDAKTASELHKGYRQGEYQIHEVLEEMKSRVEATDPHIRAWLELDWDGAARQAYELPARPHDDMPLWGIPVGIKDNIDVAGFKTRAGCDALKDNSPRRDAKVVTALREAGAIILGKLTTTELASLGNPPATGNPWNTAHTPGGSSAGPAAAVASGMVPLAIGTQTRGSIVRPASFNGIFGLSPTQGLLSTEGVVPNAYTIDRAGPFARSIDDINLAMTALLRAPGVARFSPFSPQAGHRATPVVGIPTNAFFTQQANHDAWRAVGVYRNLLQSAGIAVRDIELTVELEAAIETHDVVECAEFGAAHIQMKADSPNGIGPFVSELIAAAGSIGSTEYLQAQVRRQQLRNALIQDLEEAGVDALLTPGAPGAAPEGLQATGLPVMSTVFTFLGFPALCRPVTLAQNGLPCGAQLVGLPDSERELLRIGALGASEPLSDG